MTRKKVKVDIINVGWLYNKSKSFAGIVPDLALYCEQRPRLVETDFIKHLIEAYWKQSQKKIIYKLLYPYMAYLILNLSFLVSASEQYEEERNDKTYITVVSLAAGTIPFWLY